MAYKTVKQSARASITERRSEFIGYVSSVTTEEAATEFIAGIKKKHSDARHNVYAYLIRENNISRYTDDNEPQGTAGLPVLELLRKEGLTDVAVVVTRYFGGILLGTGGLVRAYTAAAKAALDIAGTVVYRLVKVCALTVSYADYPRIEAFLQDNPAKRYKTDFGT